MADLFLGIDAGSSVLKAAIFDKDGRQQALASRRTPLDRPRPGWVEADPDACLEALFSVTADALRRCPNPGAVAAIGICGAMVGAWLVDENGRAVRPGINWEDSRTQPMLDDMIAARPTLMSDIFAISGSALQQGCTLPLLAWLDRHEPETLARATHVLTYKDFLRHALTGTFAADRSEAAVMPGDARAQGRSAALMDLFSIADLAPLLPPVLASDEIAGRLSVEAAARTGLAAGIPVVAGAGDVIANVIGAGGMGDGAATAILGTTCMVGVCRNEPVFTPPDLGLLFSLPERHWYRAMVNVAGTLNLDWTLMLVAPDLAGEPDLFARVTAMAEDVPPGANGVTYLPYLSESGIIAPVADANARAQFCGLHAGHGRPDLIRAVYEGVAFALADLIDLLALPENEQLTLTGGGSRSPLWCDIIAGVTERTVVVPEGSEFGARGAALLAATALGHHASVTAASCAMRGNHRLHRPTSDAAARWAEPRARFAAYRDRLLG